MAQLVLNDAINLFPIESQVVVHQNISKSRHAFKFVKKRKRNHLLIAKGAENIRVGFGFRIAPIGNDVISDIQQTFDCQMQVALGRSVDERIPDETVHIILQHRFENTEIIAQAFQPRRQDGLIDQKIPPASIVP
jgi:hypothetical protein